MPDQAPPAPEGCVYGPWWDEDIRKDGCWCYSDGKLSYAWLPSFSTWVVTESAALRKLLRLAKENAELRAENERLKLFEPKPKVIDCANGIHDWVRIPKTDQMHECKNCGMVSGK